MDTGPVYRLRVVSGGPLPSSPPPSTPIPIHVCHTITLVISNHESKKEHFTNKLFFFETNVGEFPENVDERKRESEREREGKKEWERMREVEGAPNSPLLISRPLLLKTPRI